MVKVISNYVTIGYLLEKKMFELRENNFYGGKSKGGKWKEKFKCKSGCGCALQFSAIYIYIYLYIYAICMLYIII